MTQIKNINPCVTVTQTEWNKLEVLEVMQILLHKTCVRYTQNRDTHKINWHNST